MKLELPRISPEYSPQVGDLIISNEGKSSQLIVFSRKTEQYYLLSLNSMNIWQTGFKEINDLVRHYHRGRKIKIIPKDLLTLRVDNPSVEFLDDINVEDLAMITTDESDLELSTNDKDEVDTQSSDTKDCHDWEILPYVYTTENYQLAITRKCRHCGISEKLTSDKWTPELLTQYAEAVKRRNSNS